MKIQICSKGTYALLLLLSASIVLFSLYLYPRVVLAQTTTAGYVATTTVNLSICGNVIVERGEECEAPGETGGYSTTIVGRQCDVDCDYGPYCGDAILQTLYGEECDDGNNTDTDFCSALCIIEPAGGSGGGSSGGGGGGGGGSNEDLGDTQISVTGRSVPSQTVHVLLDGKEVGTVRTDSEGRFDFATNASPGTVSLGFWTLDAAKNKSITYTTTFDVTQGAITNVNGILVPPTISANDTTVNSGDQIIFSGGTVPNTKVEVHIDGSSKVLTTTSGANGVWTLPFSTAGLSNAEHTARARFILGSGGLTTQSSFSTTLQLFIGVAGATSRPSDLNRDGGINLIDFSILIFWWGTSGGNSDPRADINGNSNVGLEDFSILLFNWTG